MKPEDALALLDVMALQAVHEPPPVPAENVSRRYVEIFDQARQVEE